MIQPDGQVTTALLLAVFMLVLLLAGLLVLVAAVLLTRRHRNEKERDEAWERMKTVVHASNVEKDQTVDRWEPGPNAFGFLTVLHSDDWIQIGHHFELRQPCTTLGRSKDNDIKFPKDSPVSSHGQISGRTPAGGSQICSHIRPEPAEENLQVGSSSE